uniref:Protein-serine/threonine kinase n=1 Tax=Lotharella globosa TaxID=91324 RepID=A0A7S3YTG3_9EUKA
MHIIYMSVCVCKISFVAWNMHNVDSFVLGFGRKHLNSIWTHLHFPEEDFTHHSTKAIEKDQIKFAANEDECSPLINGYSRHSPRLARNGLPVCRLYARHFGGDLTIQVMENHGTDVFVTIPKDGEVPEALPESLVGEVELA